MKLLALLGVGFLAVGLGCQSGSQPSNAANNTANTPKSEINKAIAEIETEEAEDDAPRITLADAKKLYDGGEAVFVDTRGKQFYAMEHVKGALNVPVDEFDATYKAVPKDKKIVAYCS